jgi:hypothetical protein
MREILFRGKGTHGFANGKWVYGYYAKDFWGEKHKGFGILPLDGGYSEVDPETVGQYTGLTDKNGKKIFEGDIVRVRQNGDFGIVVIGYEHGAFVAYPKTTGIYEQTLWDYWYCDWTLSEIIGNIHENTKIKIENLGSYVNIV